MTERQECEMWSKTRQVLESRLADDLKGRVCYHYDVYRGKKHPVKPDWYAEAHVISILVDGTPWFCTNQGFWIEKYKCYNPEPKDVDIIRETGKVPCEDGMYALEYIHQYLNVLSIDEAVAHDNYFIRLLAVLDARLGKRRIKALADSIANEPEWFRKWILLRAGTQNHTM